METFAKPRPAGEETPSLWETLTYPSLAGGNTPSIGGDLRRTQACWRRDSLSLGNPYIPLAGRREYSLNRWRPSQEPRPVGEKTPSPWETLTYPSLAGGNTPSIGGDLRKNPGLLAKRLPLPGERAGVRGILHLSYAVPRDCQSYAKPAPDTDTGVSSERELELAPYLIRRRG